MRLKLLIPLMLAASAGVFCIVSHNAHSDENEISNEASPAPEAKQDNPPETKAPDTAAIPVYGGGPALEAEEESPARSAKNEMLKAPEISNYKKWKVVNPKAHYISARFAAACAPGFSIPSSAPRIIDSHPSNIGKYIRVFVNDKGKAAMFAKTPRFPVGSVIVKEKLPAKTAVKPELLTVMIKRAPGFDKSKGDWEYLVAEGSGKKAYQRGKLANCQSCHLEQPKSDYVFRHYLPETKN